jgi:ABC-2 type transport system permease protein
MTKIWHIIKYEYTRHVFQKRFLFSLLSLPALVIVMIGVVLLIAFFSIEKTPVGYIDLSGVLDDPVRETQESTIFNPVIEFLPYSSEQQAKADLEDGKIQAYYILPESYPNQLDVRLIYLEEPDSEIQGQFASFVFQNLSMFKDLDPQILERLAEGNTITLKALDGSREMQQDQWFLFVSPFIVGIMFVIVLLTSGGYLLQAVVEEKENRTMEIVITSVSPRQLMTGKIIGDIGVGLTQLVIWLVFGWLALKIGGQFLPFLSDFSLPAGYVGLLLLVLLPSFVMIAAIMAAIGATMTELREAQQFQSLITLPMMIPFYISSSIMMNPNSSIAIILSYFPLTAPLTIIMRMGFTTIPTWQIGINIAILIIFAGLAVWFAGRAFRLGMLQYGKKLSFKEIFSKGKQR